MRYIFTFLLLLTCVQVRSDSSFTKEEALSDDMATQLIGQPATRKAIYPSNTHKLIGVVYNVGSKRWPQDVLFFWRTEGDDLKLSQQISSEKGETFDKPEFFQIQQHTFVNVSTEPSGSAGFVRDMIFWLAPDGSMHEVSFQGASETFENLELGNQFILSGGVKEFYVDEGNMRFQFWLGSEGDPHCCPSGGTVTGTYKLTGAGKYDFFRREYVSSFKVMPDHLEHSSPPLAQSASRTNPIQ